METSTSLKDLPKGSFTDNKKVVLSILKKSENKQQQLAEDHLQDLFESATDINSASSNHTCLDLCYFIDTCRKSRSSVLRDLAFSCSTCLKLFDFYLEWNDRNSQKAMRQVLDSTAALLSSNPDKLKAATIKETILHRVATAISHKSSQAFVKPAFKSLEIFLSKKILSSLEILTSYLAVVSQDTSPIYDSHPTPEAGDFDPLVSAAFDWMSPQDVSPAAGKFLVALFLDLRKLSATPESPRHASLWQKWILRGLLDYPESLENIKNHILSALFKLDRSGSIEFLKELSQQTNFSSGVVGDLSENATLLLAAMEVGKKSSLIEDANTDEELMGRSKKRDHILLPERAIGDLLSHTSISIRSAALSVLVTSTTDTRPFTAETLGFLRQSLGHMHADSDAQARNNLLSSTKNMLRRLDCAIRYLSGQLRSQSQPLEPSSVSRDIFRNTSRLLEIHQSFKNWYLNFLTKELVPTASYQRHVTALRAFMSLPEMNNTESQQIESIGSTVFSPTFRRLILDVVADPFEDVRSCAALILRTIGMNPTLDRDWKKKISPGNWIWDESALDKHPLKLSGGQGSESDCVLNPNLIFEFVSNTERAARKTGRADLGDGVARAHELLYSLLPTSNAYYGQEFLPGLVSKLEESIQIAETNLANAVQGYPVHGYFASLCLIVDRISPDVLCQAEKTENGEFVMVRRWSGIIGRLIQCCKKIWERVEEVLCNDSPEGHLPRGLQIDDFENIDTKELLSYSFRAIHESSNLMRAIVSKMNLRFGDGSPFLDPKDFEQIGDLTFKQLASLRHRGAFSTVSLTFAKCCQQTQTLSLSTSEKNAMLRKWYQGSLDCIFEQVSTTRRSAGIPALITGILSANADDPSFGSIMTELQTQANQPAQLSENDEINLPQVHAMNCMKEIYKTSILSKKSELYIAPGLQLAVDCLQSDIWAMRNCGLLLLRSLIDRMFGTNESKSVAEAGWDGLSIKLSYDKYHALPDLLIKLLDVQTDLPLSSADTEDRAIQTVFPALDIIRRAGPPMQYRQQIHDLVSRHLGSRVWHVRDIAARTMCTLIIDDWLEFAIALLESCLESTNRCHGVLMTLKYMFEKLESSKSVVSSELSIFVSQFRELQGTIIILRGSPDVRAAYIEVVTVVMKIAVKTLSLHSDDPLAQAIRSLVPDQAEQILESPISCSETSSFDHDRYLSLFRRALGLQVVFKSATLMDVAKLRESIDGSMIERDPDTTYVLLEAIPGIWSALNDNLNVLEALAGFYVAVLLKSTSPQVQSISARNLAAVLDLLTGMGDLEYPTLDTIDQITLAFDTSQGSPELSNARIRLSGSLLTRQIKRVGGGVQNEEASRLGVQLLEWGQMLTDAGHANNDFDTRYAAVETLEAFYSHLPESEIISYPAFVPSLLALYDGLVDDDDEVRDVSARIVSRILGGCLVPLAAQTKFFSWLEKHFMEDDSLCDTTLARLTGGNVEPIGSQLSLAMEEDDTLFVEEEQNLFSDEVRETRIWAEILMHAKGIAWEGVITRLSLWVVDGLDVMRSAAVAEKVDGPRGWTSDPQVFAICMRLILTGNALIAHYIVAREDRQTSKGGEALKSIVGGMEALLVTGVKHRLHESLLEEVRGGLCLYKR